MFTTNSDLFYTFIPHLHMQFTIGNKCTLSTNNSSANNITSFLQVQGNRIGIEATSLEQYVGTKHCSFSFTYDHPPQKGQHKNPSSPVISKEDFHCLLHSYHGTELVGKLLKALVALSAEIHITSYTTQTDSLKHNKLGSNVIICSRKILHQGKTVEL